MPFKVLGIACSPRRLGNTARLLREALHAVQEKGHPTDMIALADLRYEACTACGGCSRTGICVRKDDMDLLYSRLPEADRIIVAAPVFFMGLNAQAKMMIDRLQPFWVKKYVLQQPVGLVGQPPRRGLFISVAATKYKDVFDCAEKTVQAMFHILDVEYAGECLYKGYDAAGEIEQHPTALAEVRAAAQTLVNM